MAYSRGRCGPRHAATVRAGVLVTPLACGVGGFGRKLPIVAACLAARAAQPPVPSPANPPTPLPPRGAHAPPHSREAACFRLWSSAPAVSRAICHPPTARAALHACNIVGAQHSSSPIIPPILCMARGRAGQPSKHLPCLSSSPQPHEPEQLWPNPLLPLSCSLLEPSPDSWRTECVAVLVVRVRSVPLVRPHCASGVVTRGIRAGIAHLRDIPPLCVLHSALRNRLRQR
jgi:hypothetical protein